jgi:antirestriction protein ArdC
MCLMDYLGIRIMRTGGLPAEMRMWRPEGAVGQQPLLMLARAGSTGVPAGRARGARWLVGDPFRASSDTDSGVEVARDIHFLKGYTVFKVEQIDGLPEQYTAPASPRLDVSARITRAECFFGATGATLAHGGNRAIYRPSTDSIVLPLFETFRDAESYYAPLAHETTHWTAHESRLARDFGTKRFGSEGYAIEELVAELGAAFLCADLDLTLEPREDHAAYIANWLEVLKSDNRAIFTAASHAQRAADFINGLQPASAG